MVLDQGIKGYCEIELLFAGLIVATHFAKDCKSTLVIISATIGLLAAAWTLSMINQENLASATNALSGGYACFQHSYYVYTFG